MKQNTVMPPSAFRYWYLPALLTALLILVFVISPGYALSDGDSTRIMDNISVGGVLLEGLNRQEAESKLKTVIGVEIKNHRLVLRRPDQSWSYSYESLGIKPDVEDAVSRAMNVGHSWNPVARYSTLKRLQQKGLKLTLHYSADNAKTEAILAAVMNVAGKKPVNARLIIDKTGEIAVQPHLNGFAVDMDRLREQMQDINLFEDTVIVLEGTDILPAVTTSGMETHKPTGLVAATTTKFNPSITNRVNNIAIGAKAINNTLLAPAEEFSFNKVVGPRTADRGFLDANVIVRGKFVLDVGGGICQVSSTLYNSVVKSGLTVTERSPHSLPVPYLPMGADATLVFGAKDFRFKNNTEKYILIKTSLGRDNLTVQIVGDAAINYGKTVKIISERISQTPFKTVRVPDPTLPVGKEKVDNPGANGYVVKVYMLTTFADGTTKKELVNESRYKPFNRVILVGTKVI